MTTATVLETALRELPGLVTPPRERLGAWRVRVTAAALPETMRRLLGELGGVLLLVAGEDRRSDVRAHYLLGFPGSGLAHVELTLDRENPTVPSLAAVSFPASRFEREMRDLLGIVPDGHPDPRPLVRHGFWPDGFHPLRKDSGLTSFADDGRPFPFTSVEGEGVYEIPVGPVHAGVIEPGHFRFNVLGETILKMRARLYFTHKGTERLFEGRTPAEGLELAERISGDTTAGHALAYAQAVESLAGAVVPERARLLRTIVLELERLYNHVTDAGAIIADTGFAIGQSHCLRVREQVMRLNKSITGSRLLRGGIVPGGVADGLTLPDSTLDSLRRARADFEEMMDICLRNTLVQDRLHATGRLAPDVARDFGVVGYVARACGIGSDIRTDYPFAAYADGIDVTPIVESAGDVAARLLVRTREVAQAVDIIAAAAARLTQAPEGVRSPIGPLAPFTPAFGIVEAWRGRLVHMVVADDSGRFCRVKVVDPSFFNWPALARTLEETIVPDFPLCNKSFNQSYSGNDL